jgi:hypothetical protein
MLEEEGSVDMLLQDKAPPRFHKEVADVLNRKFPEKWIGRSGPITWPPRSPDLNSLDFFYFEGTSRITFGLKINTESAGPLTVPSLNICKM